MAEPPQPVQDLAAGPPPTKARASSVLNRNVREFGVAHLFDRRHDTCWNSEQGSPQWVHLHFQRPVRVEAVQLMFQGGFAGKEVQVSVVEAPAPTAPSSSSAQGEEAPAAPPAPPQKGKARAAATFYPEDDNSLQIRRMKAYILINLSESEQQRGVMEMRLTFPSSTDFYGRVTLYQLKVLGREAAADGGQQGDG